ncbi:MAG: UDP-3-O-acyl-N-acetylglucosamine deacetylase, partial [Candidatus Omnitrophota bacterium]
MQKTIKKEISIKGVGLHTGHAVEMKFKPLGPNMGVMFQRIDLEGQPLVKVDINSLLSLKKNPRRTTISINSAEIQTVEHLMAALSGLGIDNLLVEINNDEVPGMDGSPLGFVQALKSAGIQEQGHERKVFKVARPLWAADEDSSIVVLPSSDFKISYTLCYSHPAIGSQHLELKIGSEVFEKELASARTFCLQEEVGALTKSGMGKGANYENTLVIGPEGVIKNKLRFK